ncbi:MAG: helix-turn-helix domain-containing protein, partial [Achromobacter sp.]|uniref:helix-turn-helix domain-containing protein n=1 Tax=Achromobacter sp. TaxID=134375 RepID=UPI0025852189
DEPLEIVRGSGNVFRDFGHPNADVEHMKAQLAAKIIGVLDERKLSVREAGKLAGVQYADISRVRNVDLDKFSVEWLTKVVNQLVPTIEVNLTFSEKASGAQALAY